MHKKYLTLFRSKQRKQTEAEIDSSFVALVSVVFLDVTLFLNQINILGNIHLEIYTIRYFQTVHDLLTNENALHPSAVLVTDTDNTSPFQCLIKASRSFICCSKLFWSVDSCNLSFIKFESLSNAAKYNRNNPWYLALTTMIQPNEDVIFAVVTPIQTLNVKPEKKNNSELQ